MPSTRSAARSPSRAVPRVCPTLASWSSYGFLAMISPIPRLGGPWSARASTDVFGHSPHLGQDVSVLTAPSVVILAMVRTGRNPKIGLLRRRSDGLLGRRLGLVQAGTVHVSLAAWGWPRWRSRCACHDAR